MSRVFVIQRPTERVAGQIKDKFDLSPAKKFGTLVELLSPTAKPFNPKEVVGELNQKLSDYDPEKDYILCIGNPTLIGWAVAIAASFSDSGNVQVLQWHGKDKRYIPIVAELFDDNSLVNN